MISEKLINRIRKENIDLHTSHQKMRYRKITSNAFTIDKFRETFSSFIIHCKKENYPFSFHLSEHGDKSMPTIQISTTQIPTGAYKIISKKDDNGLPYKARDPIIEEGGAIVATFFLDGRVSVFIYPRRSSVMRPAEDQLVIVNAADPREITDKLIESSLKKLLFYIRATTYITDGHTFSLKDRIRLSILRFNDVRFKYKLINSIRTMNNEWGKILFAAFIAWAITYISTSGPK